MWYVGIISVALWNENILAEAKVDNQNKIKMADVAILTFRERSDVLAVGAPAQGQHPPAKAGRRPSHRLPGLWTALPLYSKDYWKSTVATRPLLLWTLTLVRCDKGAKFSTTQHQATKNRDEFCSHVTEEVLFKDILRL